MIEIKIRKKLKEVYDYLTIERRLKVAYVCLRGSQNYNMDIYNDNYQSDFDYLAVVIPTLDDLIRSSDMISKVIEFDGGQIDLKDIRLWIRSLCKANPAYLETIYTSYFICNQKYETYIFNIRDLKDEIVDCHKIQFVKAIHGMAYDKYNGLFKVSPSTEEDIKKYGYSRKNYHHLQRLLVMLEDYIQIKKVNFVPSETCIEYLKLLKTKEYNKADVVNESNIALSFINNAVKSFVKINVNGNKNIDSILYEISYLIIKSEIENKGDTNNESC